MNARTATIRKFIAGTYQSDEEVIRQFTVRQGELQIVLRTLADNIDAACCQHLLLIAPRGRGKTMMLARVAAEIRANGELAPHYLPVQFMEESQEIFCIADFWLETLFHLATAAQKHDADLARELAKAHADFATRWEERNIAEHVRSTVLSAADRIGKKLLLMVENLQSLSDNVDDDFGWQLRETLQCEPQIALLATAASRFAALDDAKAPFFELFRTINLEPLDIGSCRRLWQAISGDDLSDREIRPLQILTGGSSRFLVIMGEFSRHRSMRELLEELVTLIDDHTEYFRSYTEVLAKLERRVYLAVADLWQPSTTGEIASRARMDVRKASTLIGRLVKRGALIVHGTGRRQSYSVAERLYCIYYKLRRERDEAAVVHSLIRFMTAFYSGPEFANLVEHLRTEAIKHPAIREGLKRGGIDVADLNQTRSKDDTTNHLLNSGADRRSSPTARVLLDEAWQLTQTGQHKDALDLYEETVALLANNGSPEPADLAATALFNKGWTLGKLGREDDEIATYDEIIHQFGDSATEELMELVAGALLNKGLTLGTLGRENDEIAAYGDIVRRFGDSEEPGLMAEVAKAILYTGVTLGKLGREKDAISAYDDIVQRFGGSDAPELAERTANALLNKGLTLRTLGREDDEIAAYGDIVRRFGGSEEPALMEEVAKAILYTGLTLGKLGREEDAISAYDDIVERFGGSDAPELMEGVAKALFCKSQALARLGRSYDEMATYDEIVLQFADSDSPALMAEVAKALLYKGVALGMLGEEQDELAAYEEIVHQFPDNDGPEPVERVAKALLSKSSALKTLGKKDHELAVSGEAVQGFGNGDAPDLQETITTALAFRALAANRAGDPTIALTLCDDIDSRISPPTVNAVICMWLRTEALVLLRKHLDAMRILEAAYKALDPSDSRLIPIASSCISNFVAAGADQGSILRILTSDKERAASLLPLIVALRCRLGEDVRVPTEVEEVAQDIMRYIDERSSGGAEVTTVTEH
ncbi:MAG: hypothetical protein OXP11_14010 [Gammaproteobacteria bacterium]|nr:hypothetical protein [Gammaproteobacteria bacterium]